MKKIIKKRAFENLQNKLKIIEVDANNDVINMHWIDLQLKGWIGTANLKEEGMFDSDNVPRLIYTNPVTIWKKTSKQRQIYFKS